VSEPEQLNRIIARKSFSRVARKSQRLDLIRAGWEAVAGDLASHTEPTRLARGTLTVRAEGASWASEASMSSATMLMRLDRMLGKGAVKRIRVQAGQAERAAGEPMAAGREGPESEENLPGELGEQLSKIGDDDVRRALAKLAAASKPGKQSEQP